MAVLRSQYQTLIFVALVTRSVDSPDVLCMRLAPFAHVLATLLYIAFVVALHVSGAAVLALSAQPVSSATVFVVFADGLSFVACLADTQPVRGVLDLVRLALHGDIWVAML